MAHAVPSRVGISRRDLGNFIARDFNHLSVIMWSLGNETPEQNESLGAKTAPQNKFDVVGYNYEKDSYLSDRERNPNRLMYGSETYPRDAFDYWFHVEKYPFVIGDFVWTGWDYLGEAGTGWTGYGPEWQGIAPYPWHLAYCGEIDALGYKRPLAYYRNESHRRSPPLTVGAFLLAASELYRLVKE